MLERFAPRPRDITFLPPLSLSSGASSLKFPEKKMLSDIPPPTPLKNDAPMHQRGFDSSSSSIVDASPNMLSSTTPPSFGPPLKLPYPSTAPGTPEENGPRVADLRDEPPFYKLPLNPPLSPERLAVAGSFNDMLPRLHPPGPQSDLSLEDPFKHLNPTYKPRTPLPNTALQQSGDPSLSLTPGKRQPQLPYPAHVASSGRRLSGIHIHSGRRKSVLDYSKAKRGTYQPRFLPPYRPKTPPAGWFLSQNQVNAVSRSASLPELPVIGNKTFAERSLEENSFRPGPMKLDFEPLPVGPVQKPVNMDNIKPYQPLPWKNGLRPIPMDKFQHGVKKAASSPFAPQAKMPNPFAFPRDLPPVPARDPIPSVKFIDYTQAPNPHYTKFSSGRGQRILMEKERPGPFGMREANIFALKLLVAVSLHFVPT